MKKQLFVISLVTIVALSLNLTSCGGTSSSKESLLFGKVPAIAAKLNAQQEELKAKLESSSSESDAKAVFEKYEKLYADARANAETAAQEWSGSTLALENTDELTVKTPVSVLFKDFFSKSSINPSFYVAGEVVAATDIPVDEYNTVTNRDGSIMPMTVNLIALDAEGNEVLSHQIGNITPISTDGKTSVIPAGTPVQFDKHWITMYDNKAAEYAKIKSMKLAIHYLKMK